MDSVFKAESFSKKLKDEVFYNKEVKNKNHEDIKPTGNRRPDVDFSCFVYDEEESGGNARYKKNAGLLHSKNSNLHE
jgi:hypothetical protein